MNFQKKPVIVQAFQWNGINTELPSWAQGKMELHRTEKIENSEYLIIPTLEGKMQAGIGDWIIQGIAGEIYPCKAEIFAATYDSEETMLATKGARGYGLLLQALQDDPAFAWSWHCNVAVVAQDEGLDHAAANRAAARFIKAAFGVDTSVPPLVDKYEVIAAEVSAENAQRAAAGLIQGEANDCIA